MSLDLEEQLTAGMRSLGATAGAAGDVLGRATRRHRRRTTAVRAGYALGVAGLAGVLAIGLTMGGPTGPTGPTGGAGGATTQVESAALRLQRAAAASDNISYKIKLTYRTAQGQVMNSYEGAFDPLTSTGYLNNPNDDSVLRELLIDGTRYIGSEPPLGPLPADKIPGGEQYGRYGQYPGRHDRLSIYGDGDPVLNVAAPDPAALYDALQQVHATISRNPDGTLHYEYRRSIDAGFTTSAGDVLLNAEGRIEKIQIAFTWQSSAKGPLESGGSQATLELSGYGLPVHVDRPADVIQTS